MLSAVLFLRNLFLPRYEVRVSHPVDHQTLANLAPRAHRVALEDLSQESAVSIHRLLRDVGVHGSLPVVAFSGDAVRTTFRVRLPNDLAAMDLSDALKAHLCKHATVLVVPNETDTIEAVLQR